MEPRPMEQGEISEELSDGKRDILQGVLSCMGCLFVTVVTYASAAPGVTYSVSWLTLLFGLIKLVKGLMQKEKYQKEKLRLERPPSTDTYPGIEHRTATSSPDRATQGDPSVPPRIALSIWLILGFLVFVIVLWNRSKV